MSPLLTRCNWSEGYLQKFVGLLVSCFQSLMNRGSKYWQERWESKTKNSESILTVDVTKTQKYAKNERYYLDAGILGKNENLFTKARRFSVSKLTILVWDIVTISSFFLWLNSCHFGTTSNIRWNAIFFHVLILIYILIFFRNGKVYEPLVKRKSSDPNNCQNQYCLDHERYCNNEIDNE